MTTDELRAKFEAISTASNIRLRLGELTESDVRLCRAAMRYAWQAAHISRDAEVEALRKDAENALRTFAAAVDAAGGEVLVLPKHLLNSQRGKLVKHPDPETGGYRFVRV